MKVRINNQVYNTDTSTVIYTLIDEAIGYKQTLYETRIGGFFFLNETETTKVIKPTDKESAIAWVRTVNPAIALDFEQTFLDIDEDYTKHYDYLKLRIPQSLKYRIQRMAQSSGLSMNATITKILTDYAKFAMKGASNDEI